MALNKRDKLLIIRNLLIYQLITYFIVDTKLLTFNL